MHPIFKIAISPDHHFISHQVLMLWFYLWNYSIVSGAGGWVRQRQKQWVLSLSYHHLQMGYLHSSPVTWHLVYPLFRTLVYLSVPWGPWWQTGQTRLGLINNKLLNFSNTLMWLCEKWNSYVFFLVLSIIQTWQRSGWHLGESCKLVINCRITCISRVVWNSWVAIFKCL